MNAIQTQGLQKIFGKVCAIDNLTIEIKPGTVFGFLGPNGAGKTTTVRILTGLAKPTQGKAWVAGLDLSNSKHKVARQIGYLPEDPVCYPWMNPQEFLDYVGRIFGLSTLECKKRTDELLELVDLVDVKKRRVGNFSRGMRQRLALAQALINKPNVLFLDEPVSALDPVGRKEVLDLIAQLRNTCTVFMSSHILADVERVCDEVGIIKDGHLIIQAPTEELLKRYAHPVFEIEVDLGVSEQIMPWVKTIQPLQWVSSVSLDKNIARVMVNDIEQAKQNLLPTVIEADLRLIRYEMIRPSLEEVFISLVEKGSD